MPSVTKIWIPISTFVLGGILVLTTLSPGGRSAALADPVAAPNFSQIQFSGVMGGFMLFDSKNGNVFVYDALKGKGKYVPEFVGRVTEPGKPLAADQGK